MLLVRLARGSLLGDALAPDTRDRIEVTDKRASDFRLALARSAALRSSKDDTVPNKHAIQLWSDVEKNALATLKNACTQMP